MRHQPHAPIRFTAYGVDLPAVARDYVATIQALPAMQEWIAAARAETTSRRSPR